MECNYPTDCVKCDTCRYDVPLNTVFNRKNKDNMNQNFNIVPMADNPSTAVIIPGRRHEMPPVGKDGLITPPSITRPYPQQLLLPAPKKNNCFCNGCPNLISEPIGASARSTWRCSAASILGNNKRIVKANVFPNENVTKPFWCPELRKLVDESLKQQNEGRIHVGGFSVNPNSMLSPEDQKRWTESKERQELKEKWMALSGTISWDEIKVSGDYHLPPMFSRGRCNLHVVTKYANSIQCRVIGEDKNMWLYKEDEDWKFMSPIRR